MNQNKRESNDLQQVHENTKHFLIERVKRSSNYTGQSLHSHPYYELEYIISGSRSMQINGDCYDLSKGMFAFANMGELHRGYPRKEHPEEVELFNIYFFPNDIARILDLIGEDFFQLLSNRVIQIPSGRLKYIEDLLDRMVLEYTGYDNLSEGMLQSLFYELLTFLLRICQSGNDNYIQPQYEDRVMTEVIYFINQHYNETLSLETVASFFNFQAAYFSRKFKKEVGIGFCEFVRNVRLNEAAKLLKDTNLSITKIATQCGFESSNYFGDVFRKERGISPRSSRKLL